MLQDNHVRPLSAIGYRNAWYSVQVFAFRLTSPPTQVNVVLMNWSAPSLIKSEIQQTQSQLAGFVINDGDKNIGTLLMPVHVYKKGTMWLQEGNVLKRMNVCNLNCDRQMHLLFDKKQDRPE
jgi:hypothetical protein